MGKVINKINAGTNYILECTDIFIDFDSYILKAQEEDPPKDVKIILVDVPGVYLDIKTVEKLKAQLRVLTSAVSPNDIETEKFAKIVTSIRKNIKYAFTKTKSRNIGPNGNFVDGLLKGKCVCLGYAIITKMALEMHGIDTSFVCNDRHAWNQVNLNGRWYNWDMTNVKSEALTTTTMGKCLKSDADLAKNKIYQNNDAKISCPYAPEQWLIDNINTKIKENINNVPKIKKETLLSTFLDKIKGMVNKKMNKSEMKLLPEKKEESMPIKSECDYSNFEPILSFNDRGSIVWKITTWNQSNVCNEVRTLYLELPQLGTPQSLSNINKEEFNEIYKALQGNKIDAGFVGKMELIKDENGEEHWVGCNTSSKECKDIVDLVEKTIQDKEQKSKFRIQEQNIERTTNGESRL